MRAVAVANTMANLAGLGDIGRRRGSGREAQKRRELKDARRLYGRADVEEFGALGIATPRAVHVAMVAVCHFWRFAKRGAPSQSWF
jgi:hypothetical protein